MKLKFERYLSNTFLVAMSCFLTFALAEIISRPLMPHRRSDIERSFSVQATRVQRPYVMFGGKPNEEVKEERLNQLGYRGKIPNPRKEDNEFRVFMLGGSTVFVGEPPIAVLLENEFHTNGLQNVNVFNFGVVASVSGMELSRILFEVSDYEPDLVIFYNGNNDIDHPYHWDPRPGYPFTFIAYENNPVLENDIRSYPTIPLLLYGSNLIRYFAPRYFIDKFIPLEQERRKAQYNTESWREVIAKIYVSNLVKARIISEAFGAEFIAFFQPMLDFKDNLSIEEEKMSNPTRKSHSLDVRKRILANLELVRQDTDIIVIDLSDIYDDTDATIFRDRVHTLQTAKSVIAKEIFRNLSNEFSLER